MVSEWRLDSIGVIAESKRNTFQATGFMAGPFFSVATKLTPLLGLVAASAANAIAEAAVPMMRHTDKQNARVPCMFMMTILVVVGILRVRFLMKP
jgi:hypothetical protein